VGRRGARTLAELIWIDSPRWLSAIAYLLVGWVGVLAIPQMFSRAGVAVAVLLLVGGGLYSLGAVIYATRWPNPFPRVSASTRSFTSWWSPRRRRSSSQSLWW
jgi:channel protein (hemolysin III family)